jgi:hypothetical protein
LLSSLSHQKGSSSGPDIADKLLVINLDFLGGENWSTRIKRTTI